jgi:hypothetical protein
MDPTECTPAWACPELQAAVPLEALAAWAMVRTPRGVEWAPLRVARCPPVRVTVEAWGTAAAALLAERAAADMVNRRSRYRVD